MTKYMLIMRGTDESMAKMMETPFEEMLENYWALQRGVDPRRRARRCRGPR